MKNLKNIISTLVSHWILLIIIICGVFSSSFIMIYFLDHYLFLTLDTLKLVLLSISISTPPMAMVYIAEMIIYSSINNSKEILSDEFEQKILLTVASATNLILFSVVSIISWFLKLKIIPVIIMIYTLCVIVILLVLILTAVSFAKKQNE